MRSASSKPHSASSARVIPVGAIPASASPGAKAVSGAKRETGSHEPIRRRDLTELHDLPWWPKDFRATLTNLLVLVWRFPWITLRDNSGRRRVPSQGSLAAGVIGAALPTPSRGDDGTLRTRVVDLCSGSGGPWAEMLPLLESHSVEVTLTDLYPISQSTDCIDHLHPHPMPVDATMVPAELSGTRTMIGCLHHFPPQLARRIFQDAVDQGENLVVIESCQRSIVQTIGAGLLMIPLSFVTPLIYFRQTSWRVLALTYVIPIMPLICGYDGMVSCLRAYTPGEMLTLVSELENADDYDFRSGTESFLGLFHVTYLVGVTKS